MNGGQLTIEDRRIQAVGWLNDIYRDVQDLIIDDHTFWEVQEIIRRNPRVSQSSGHFNHWMMAAHVESAVIGVRRQLKSGGGSISLRRLLNEFVRCPGIVSRENYIHVCSANPNVPRNMLERDFDRLVGAGRSHLDPTNVQAELDEMTAVASNVEHLADRRYAHYDPRGLAAPQPTFTDIGNSLKLFERLILRYKLLLKGAAQTTLLPTFLYDWKDVFRLPWIMDAEPTSEGN